MAFQNPIVPQKVVEYTIDRDVQAGQIVDEFIRAKLGFLYEMRAMSIQTLGETGASSGNHTLNLEIRTNAWTIGLLYGESNYNSELIYNYGIWRAANQEQRPPEMTEQSYVPNEIIIDSSRGMRIVYRNDLDSPSNLNVAFLFKATRIDESA